MNDEELLALDFFKFMQTSTWQWMNDRAKEDYLKHGAGEYIQLPNGNLQFVPKGVKD